MHGPNVHRHILLDQFIQEHLTDSDVTGNYEVQGMRLLVLPNYDPAGTIVFEVRHSRQFAFHMLIEK